MFLVYCAALGLSLVSLASLAAAALREDMRAWYREPPVKLTGGLQIALAVVFAALWLSEIVTALARGGVPESVAEGGFTTNPVHVLDLSILLPALAVNGVATLRRRPLGYFLGPVLLTFGILMAVTIGVLVVAMRRRGLGGDLTIPVMFGGVALVSVIVLGRFLRDLKPRR